MHNVKLTARAQADLIAIANHISDDDPAAAIALTDAILARIHDQSPDNPNSGRPGRVKRTRELVVHRSYIAVYRVQADTVQIITIRHSARLWPGSF